MRFGLAIASLVISGLLLLLGIGQRTVFAGPAEIVYGSPDAPGARYAVIAADQFSEVAGQANLVLGGSDAFAAIGSTNDIEAWLAPLDHVVLTADDAAGRLSGRLVRGEASDLDEDQLASLDPRDSDLWLAEQGSGRAPVALLPTQSMLIDLEAGGSVSVAWVQSGRTPWAGPLLAAGGLFAVLGLVLYLLAVDHDRRGLGPRRGRSGPLLGIRNIFSRGARQDPPKRRGTATGGTATGGTAANGTAARGAAPRRLMLPSLGLAGLLVLSGCSSSYWPEFPAKSEPAASEADDPAAPDVAPVPVSQAQIDRIIADIVAVADEADEALDKKLLKSRFTDDAYTQRSKHYQIRKKDKDYEVVLPRITDEQLGYELVQSTDGWPRTVFVTVASAPPAWVIDEAEKKAEKEAAAEKKDAESSEADAEQADAEQADPEAAAPTVEPPASPSLAMVLVQRNPHENYLVTRLFALRGGISMPSAAPAEEGTARLPDDMQTLALMPGQVGSAYAKVLVGGKKAKQARHFDLEDDTIIEKSGAAWVAAAKKAAKKDGYDVKYSVTAKQAETAIVSLSTGVGGALVSTTVLESRIEKQSGKYQPKAVGAVTALSGLKGAQKQIVSQVAHQLLFFVPSESSDERIQLLGYTTELVGAGKK